MAGGKLPPADTTPSPPPSLTSAGSTDNSFRSHGFGSEQDEEMQLADFLNVETAGFTSVNMPAAAPHPGTVSPQDLFSGHGYNSAPASNTLTNLTTPSMGYDDSPEFGDSLETSPMFADNDHLSGESEWASLFPAPDVYVPAVPQKEESFDGVSMSRTTSAQSLGGQYVPPKKADDPLRPSMSEAAGVHRNRRTGKMLGPIAVEASDSKAVKRAKNTMAARKSRQKKRDVEDGLRDDVERLRAERDHWMRIALKHGAGLPEVEPYSPPPR